MSLTYACISHLVPLIVLRILSRLISHLSELFYPSSIYRSDQKMPYSPEPSTVVFSLSVSLPVLICSLGPVCADRVVYPPLCHRELTCRYYGRNFLKMYYFELSSELHQIRGDNEYNLKIIFICLLNMDHIILYPPSIRLSVHPSVCPFNFHVSSISSQPLEILKYGSNICLVEAMCRSHISTMSNKSQDHVQCMPCRP